jgi:hypothetical protein
MARLPDFTDPPGTGGSATGAGCTNGGIVVVVVGGRVEVVLAAVVDDCCEGDVAAARSVVGVWLSPFWAIS